MCRLPFYIHVMKQTNFCNNNKIFQVSETLDQLSGPLMKNKKGLIMGVANNHSLAWGIAKI